MFLILYNLLDCSKTHIENIEYFINYGMNNELFSKKKKNYIDLFILGKINCIEILKNILFDKIDNNIIINNDKNQYNNFINAIIKINNDKNVINYEKIFLLNSDLIGPIFHFGLERHWIDYKIYIDNDKLKSSNNNFIMFKSNLYNIFIKNPDDFVKDIKNIDDIYFRTNKLPEYFNWETYMYLNPSLYIYNNKYKSIYHYLKMGIKQNTKYEIDNELKKKIEKYPLLFHKYLLNVTNPYSEIKYVINYNNLNGNIYKYVSHLHCFEITDFYKIYGEYINDINIFSDFIIITYNIGDLDIPINYLKFNIKKPIVILKSENKGFDIGPKLCAYDFLKKNNIDYSYILCLHSKSCTLKRALYFKPFFINNNLQNSKILLENNNKIMGIFNNVIKNCSIKTREFRSNIQYFLEFVDFLNIPYENYETFYFSYGNCFILHKNIINFIFNDDIKLLYNNLNNETTFDIGWLKNILINKKIDNNILDDDNINTDYPICQLINKEIIDLNEIKQIYKYYEDFKYKKCIPGSVLNNNNCKHPNVTILRDGMFEHVFERLYLYVIKKMNGEFIILDNSFSEKIPKNILNLKLVLYKNIHKNNDIYIICSGKSLDYINNDFFESKITIGVNRVYQKIKCNYYMRKEAHYLEDFLDNHLTDKETLFLSKGCSGNLNNKNYDIISSKYSDRENIIVFEHDDNIYNNTIKVNKDTLLANNNKLITAFSTITSAIHLAFYMGAKNIILIGHDCCKINDKTNIDNYHNEQTLNIAWSKSEDKEKAYVNWLYSIEAMTNHIKKILKEEFDVNLLSINPFISAKELYENITI